MKLFIVFFILAIAACARTSDNPFPAPIQPVEGVIVVGLKDFATLPDIEGAAARPMLLVRGGLG